MSQPAREDLDSNVQSRLVVDAKVMALKEEIHDAKIQEYLVGLETSTGSPRIEDGSSLLDGGQVDDKFQMRLMMETVLQQSHAPK
jgi:hypothetical protein